MGKLRGRVAALVLPAASLTKRLPRCAGLTSSFCDSICNPCAEDDGADDPVDPGPKFASPMFPSPYARFANGRLVIDFLAEAFRLPHRQREQQVGKALLVFGEFGGNVYSFTWKADWSLEKLKTKVPAVVASLVRGIDRLRDEGAEITDIFWKLGLHSVEDIAIYLCFHMPCPDDFVKDAESCTLTSCSTQVLNDNNDYRTDGVELFDRIVSSDVVGLDSRVALVGSSSAIVAYASAACITQVRSCGAILSSKAHIQEFGTGTSTSTSGFNPHHVSTRNPYNASKVTRGSWSGSGTIVCAGPCLVALGVNGGGSVRMLAALSGIVRFKPTTGCFSNARVFGFSITGAVDVAVALDIDAADNDMAILVPAKCSKDCLGVTICVPASAHTTEATPTSAATSSRLSVLTLRLAMPNPLSLQVYDSMCSANIPVIKDLPRGLSIASGDVGLQPPAWPLFDSSRQGTHVIQSCLPPLQIVNWEYSQPKLRLDLLLMASMGSVIAHMVGPMHSVLLIEKHKQQQCGGVCQTSLLEGSGLGNVGEDSFYQVLATVPLYMGSILLAELLSSVSSKQILVSNMVMLNCEQIKVASVQHQPWPPPAILFLQPTPWPFLSGRAMMQLLGTSLVQVSNSAGMQGIIGTVIVGFLQNSRSPAATLQWDTPLSVVPHLVSISWVLHKPSSRYGRSMTCISMWLLVFTQHISYWSWLSTVPRDEMLMFGFTWVDDCVGKMASGAYTSGFMFRASDASLRRLWIFTSVTYLRKLELSGRVHLNKNSTTASLTKLTQHGLEASLNYYLISAFVSSKVLAIASFLRIGLHQYTNCFELQPCPPPAVLHTKLTDNEADIVI